MSDGGNEQTNGDATFFNAPQQCAGGQRHLRSDARLIGKMFSLGVVSEEQALDLLAQGFRLGAECAKKNNIRGYVAIMKMILSYARLEQIERLKKDPEIGGLLNGVSIENAQIVFNVPDNGRGPKRLEFDGSDGT